ncbi:unnamed protein product [Caenorhabditis nigoni]
MVPDHPTLSAASYANSIDVLAAFPVHRIDILDLIASERERTPLPILSMYQFPVPHEEDFQVAMYGSMPSDRELRIRHGREPKRLLMPNPPVADIKKLSTD